MRVHRVHVAVTMVTIVTCALGVGLLGSGSAVDAASRSAAPATLSESFSSEAGLRHFGNVPTSPETCHWCVGIPCEFLGQGCGQVGNYCCHCDWCDSQFNCLKNAQPGIPLGGCIPQ